jgi:hypothetical protein
MGLRCLLGHEYANREVEREREERGDEVVVTYRTVETCDRCGERRVVSENKEVRPIRNPREEDVTTGLGGGVTADMAGEADGESAPDASPSDAAPATDETEPASMGDDGAVVDAEAETVPDAEADPDPAPDPAEEDAVILDDDATEDDDGRAHGEWPSADDEESGTTAADAATAADPSPADDGATVVSGDEAWPEPEGDDEGFDAEPSDGDPTDVSFGGGLAPERADEAATNGEDGGTATGGAVAGKQFVAAEAVEPVGEESPGETEFFCPNCGYARAAGGSSMRAGDICPDCHKGYIAEREK